MTTLLFVYGTLRRRSRHPMAHQLAQRARFVGAATIAGRLYDLGRYPGLREPELPADRVHGDVYDLGDEPDTLRELDAYENGESPLPAYFDRQLAPVRMAGGEERTAWVYWFRGPVREEQRIVSGEYEL
jgi:gamma-glutamylcyclotransferase (GGCT)/AIG2-like uncharacterized protein YtfP